MLCGKHGRRARREGLLVGGASSSTSKRRNAAKVAALRRCVATGSCRRNSKHSKRHAHMLDSTQAPPKLSHKGHTEKIRDVRLLHTKGKGECVPSGRFFTNEELSRDCSPQLIANHFQSCYRHVAAEPVPLIRLSVKIYPVHGIPHQLELCRTLHPFEFLHSSPTMVTLHSQSALRAINFLAAIAWAPCNIRVSVFIYMPAGGFATGIVDESVTSMQPSVNPCMEILNRPGNLPRPTEDMSNLFTAACIGFS